MTLEEAKKLLSGCQRDALVDHAFGDTEVYWMNGDEEVAAGYFGRDDASVTITSKELAPVTFEGYEAKSLRFLGPSGRRTRNDAGPPEGSFLDPE